MVPFSKSDRAAPRPLKPSCKERKLEPATSWKPQSPVWEAPCSTSETQHAACVGFFSRSRDRTYFNPLVPLTQKTHFLTREAADNILLPILDINDVMLPHKTGEVPAAKGRGALGGRSQKEVGPLPCNLNSQGDCDKSWETKALQKC